MNPRLEEALVAHGMSCGEVLGLSHALAVLEAHQECGGLSGDSVAEVRRYLERAKQSAIARKADLDQIRRLGE